jgi:hypothetical protein
MLRIALKRRELMAGIARDLAQALFDGGQSIGPIDPGLAAAEQVEIRTIEQQQARHRRRMYLIRVE